MSYQTSPVQAGSIDRFQITSNSSARNSIDMSGGVVDFRYYESVLSNVVTATATIVETGFQTDGQQALSGRGTIDGLPIRGGERAEISLKDSYDNELTFSNGLYVNRVRDATPGTQKDLYFLDFSSSEYFANDQTRVIKRYEGKISEHVRSILTNVLQTELTLDIDETSSNYNFIGNARKPFYTCTWLASKSIPNATALGGTAGFLFFQTKDSFKFKSVDTLLSQTSSKRYIFNNTGDIETGYDAKVLTYSIDSDIDLHEKLSLGCYNNRSLFFDPISFNYNVQDYNINNQNSNRTGTQFSGDLVATEFTQSPSRLMNMVLDTGSMPKGRSSEEQLREWKSQPSVPNFNPQHTTVQSIMRYNQLFTIQTQITIPGDFTIRAGDLVSVDVPKLEGSSNKEKNDESSGIYMVAHVCHKITPEETLTSLALVRDSYG
tara:strand:+ start:2021 stop:3322 length:1302 start_codon:yes stop_codon:yes gene_type:complete